MAYEIYYIIISSRPKTLIWNNKLWKRKEATAWTTPHKLCRMVRYFYHSFSPFFLPFSLNFGAEAKICFPGFLVAKVQVHHPTCCWLQNGNLKRGELGMMDVGLIAAAVCYSVCSQKVNSDIFSGPALWHDLAIISDSLYSTTKDPPCLPEIWWASRTPPINSFYGKIHPSYLPLLVIKSTHSG